MSAITIFEGPDGGGKTTAALRYAEATNALYYHFSAWRHMGKHTPRLYVEAMLPALLGLRDVVLDRSWLSEEPYNDVYHKDYQSLVPFYEALKLERLAMRCDTLVVFCLPPVETCIDNFNKRREREMLDNTEQLVEVYNKYKKSMACMLTSLPSVRYDYTKDGDIVDIKSKQIYQLIPHPSQCFNTVGSLMAPYIVIGDLPQEMSTTDALHRWPTINFNQADSQMERFTKVLEHNNIGNGEVFWIGKNNISAATKCRMEISDIYSVQKVLSFDPDSTTEFLKAAPDFPWSDICTRVHPNQADIKKDADFFKYYEFF